MEGRGDVDAQFYSLPCMALMPAHYFWGNIYIFGYLFFSSKPLHKLGLKKYRLYVVPAELVIFVA